MSNEELGLLILERSAFNVKSASDKDKYILEGIFTEFDSENRNGRIYTKKEFLPHFKKLQEQIKKGALTGELDHPKQFETSLNNVSHKIIDMWVDENENCIKGKIQLIDTTAGKNAKAMVDAGIPLHISSRAAGTVTENKNVKINRLFTYDLVDTPGFENARLSTCNESYGFINESYTNLAMYDNVPNRIMEDSTELNNKNNDTNVNNLDDNTKFDEYTKYTKQSIESIQEEVAAIKKVQGQLLEQNDEIVDIVNGDVENVNEEELSERLEKLSEKIAKIEEWADHVVDEFERLEESNEELSNLTEMAKKMRAFENWSNEVTETINGMESWMGEATETITAIEDWSEEATDTVSALESWSEEATQTVSALESWSLEATDTVTNLEESLTVDTTVVENEEVKSEEEVVVVVETKETTVTESEDIEEYKTSIMDRLENILEGTKQEPANNEQLNESEEVVNENVEETPLFLQHLPNKYQASWDALSESEQSAICNRADMREFKTLSSIKEFWSATFTKENLIKKDEEPKALVENNKDSNLSSRQEMIIESYKKNFGNHIN